MTELLAALGAAALWLLVFALLVLLAGRRARSAEGALLAAYPLFHAFQILIAKGLDAVGLLTGTGMRSAYAIAAAIGLVLYVRRAAPARPGRADRDAFAHPDRDERLSGRLATGAAAIVLLGLAAFSLISPVHVWDALAYHMPMVAGYVQNASLDAWPTRDLRQVLRVNGGELQLLNIALLSGSDAWVELPNLLALAVCLAASMALARIAVRRHALAYLVVALVLTAPQIQLGAVTAKNDLMFTAALLCAVYWSVRAVTEASGRSTGYAVLAGFAAGLAAATKVMGLVVLGATGLLVLIQAVRRRVPYRVPVALAATGTFTLLVLVGDIYLRSIGRSALPVGVAPNEVIITIGPGNLVAAARYYLYDLSFKRLVVLQMFEHDLSHYGYFFPFLLVLAVVAGARQALRPRARRVAVWGLALIAAAIFFSVIAVRLPIRWDQRFMIWMVPVFAILAASLGERLDGRYILVLTTAAASFALVNLFQTLSNEADGLFTRSATHLASTGSLARYTDVPSRHYLFMHDGMEVLANAGAADSVLYVGSDDSWMYPAWGGGFTRHVRGVADAEDAAAQAAARRHRFIIIEDLAAEDVREKTLRAARARGYRVIIDADGRLVLERGPVPAATTGVEG